MESDQYQAIACSQYDRYEIAIMRGQRLNISWTDASGQQHQGPIKPLALETRKGEEFLRFYDEQDHDVLTEVRLDRITLRE